MDAVKVFNSELSSLMDARPPISKAKMTAITRSAIKAIKFYKHVVQCVEKFIQKCKPEFKVPGLYVVDSIVRQSRHQFSPEKDVFAPRFARNIQNTFMQLFNCPPDDKGKVVRVLNLWQKNQVFTPDVIQPLLDMASRVGTEQPLQPTNGVQLKNTPSQQPRTPSSKPSPVKDPAWLSGNLDISASSNLASTPVKPPSNSGAIDPNIMQQLQNLQTLLLEKQSDASQIMKKDEVKFDKKLLDFDYDEDDDEPAMQQTQSQSQPPLPSIDSLQTILSNPEVLRHLQTLQQQMSSRKAEPTHDEMEEAMKLRRLQEMRHQEEEFDKHLAQTLPNLPFATECDFKPSGLENSESMSLPAPVAPPQQVSSSLPSYTTPTSNLPFASLQDQDLPSLDYDERNRHQESSSNRSAGRVDVEVIDLLKNDSPPRKSPSRRESRRRRRSRSRGRHSRSRSRSRRRARSTSEDKETERRRKRGLPPVKKNHLAVCSTTLWIGHLSKLVQEEELSDTFGHYGEIVSINLIPPRGCAFVCMNRRQDADKALKSLKHSKLHGKAITIAWAPGKAMKEREWKDFWEVDTGTSYIPWNKLSKDTDFSLLEEGGMLDDETFPDWLKDPSFRRKGEAKETEEFGGQNTNSGDQSKQKDGLAKKMPQELDIPMPTNSIPGFIPLPESTMAPPPVSHGQNPNMPPPPMGLIPPPFAMPPQRLPGLMGPMGPMGPMMGNVPLGVPPPIMMPPPPQQMVPRMPAPPFNPGPPGNDHHPSRNFLVGMMQLGPDKSKPPQMPGMPPDGFPEHLAQMFGLPIGHGMPPGVNMQQPPQNQMKGPSEMDIDDLDSKDMNTNMDLSLGPPPMGSFNQPPPNFNMTQGPLMPLPPGQPILNQNRNQDSEGGQGSPRSNSGDRKVEKEDSSRRGRDRDKERGSGRDSDRGRGDDRDSSKRRRVGDSSDRDRGGRGGGERERGRRGGGGGGGNERNERTDRNDRNRRDWGKGGRSGSKWSDREKEEDRDRKDKKSSSSGGDGKENRSSSGGDEESVTGVDRGGDRGGDRGSDRGGDRGSDRGGDRGSDRGGDRETRERKPPLLPSSVDQQGPPPPIQFQMGPPGPRPGLPGPPGFMQRFGPMDGDGPGPMDCPPQDFPPPMGDFPPQMGDFPPQMGDFPPQMGDFPPQMGDFPPQMGDFPPQMGDFPPPDFLPRGVDFQGGPPPRDFQPRGDFGPRGYFRGPMSRGPHMNMSPQQGPRGALLRTPNGPMFGPPRGPGGMGMGMRGPRGMGGPQGRMDGPPHGFMGRGFPRMDWRGGPPSRFGGPPGGPPRWDDGPPGPNRWEDGPPGPNRWEDGPSGPNRWEDGPPGPNRWEDGPPRWEEGPPPPRWVEDRPEREPRPDRGPRRSRWSTGPALPSEDPSLEGAPSDEGMPPALLSGETQAQRINIPQEEQNVQSGKASHDKPPHKHDDGQPSASFENPVEQRPGNLENKEGASESKHSEKTQEDIFDSSFEKPVEEPRRQCFEENDQSREQIECSDPPPFNDAVQAPLSEPFSDSGPPTESFEGSRVPERRDSLGGSRERDRSASFEEPRKTERRGSFGGSSEPERMDSLVGSSEPERMDSFGGSSEPERMDSFGGSREPERMDSFGESSEPERRDSFGGSREPDVEHFGNSRESPRNSFNNTREPPQDSFQCSMNPPQDSFVDTREPSRRESFEGSREQFVPEPEARPFTEEPPREFENHDLPEEPHQVEQSHVEKSFNDERLPVDEAPSAEPQADEAAQL